MSLLSYAYSPILLIGGTVAAYFFGERAAIQVASSTGSLVSKTTSAFFSSMVSSSPEQIVEDLRLRLVKLIENVDADTLSKTLVDKFIKTFTDRSEQLLTLLPKVMEQLSDALNQGTKKFKFSESMASFSDEFNEAFKKFEFSKAANSLGEELGKTIRGMSVPSIEAVTEMIGDITRGLTLNTIPYISLGAITLIGTPLLTHYLYKKAVHNIGRPSLATEMRLTGWSKIQDVVQRATSSTFRAISSGALWGVAASITATAYNVALISGCTFSYNHRRWEAQQCFNQNSLSAEGILTIGAAGTAATVLYQFGSQLASKCWEVAQQRFSKDHNVPMFNQELTAKIEEISHTAYNLHKNGGFFQNVLLSGPAGTGKTMVANAIIKGIESKGYKMNWIKMTGGTLAQYIKRGEHVSELNKLFESINNSSEPTILFIDEIEALAGNRDKMDKSELLELLDSFLSHTGTESKKFMIIGATNKPQSLDPAVLSRMDYKLHVNPPASRERVQILQQNVNNFFSQQEKETLLTPTVVKRLASQTAGLTGRALFKLINAIHAKKMASDDKQLTSKMIQAVTDDFITQERRGFSWMTRTLYALHLKDT